MLPRNLRRKLAFIVGLGVVAALQTSCAPREVAAPTAAGASLSYEAAAQKLAALTQAQVRHFSTCDFGRAKDERWLSFIVSERKAKSIVLDMQRNLAPGILVFLGTARFLGSETPNGVEIVLAKGDTQFDVLRIARSDGINYGLDTEALIKRLQRYDQKYGIAIFHAETDTIECRLLNPPGDMTALAQDLYEFCPDLVDQGVGSVDALARAVQESKELYFWWD